VTLQLHGEVVEVKNMSKKPKDMIGVLEQKAEDNLGQIDVFINMFQSAQEDAKGLDNAATAEVVRLNEVQKKCKRITSFMEKMLSATK